MSPSDQILAQTLHLKTITKNVTLLFEIYPIQKKSLLCKKKKKKKISQSSHSWPLYLCLAMPRDTHGFYILFLSTAICWESSHPFYSPTLVCKFPLLFSTSISHDTYLKTASNMIRNLKFEYVQYLL